MTGSQRLTRDRGRATILNKNSEKTGIWRFVPAQGLGSLEVGGYAIFFLLFQRASDRGRPNYLTFLNFLSSPGGPFLELKVN